MDYIGEILNAAVQTLREIEKKYTAEYEKTPPGGLVCNYNHNRDRFYHAQNIDGKYVRDRITPFSDDGQRTLKQLARKEYLRVQLHDVKKNIAILGSALSGYYSLNSTDTLLRMKRAYKMLDSTWFFSEDAEQVRELLKKEIKARIGTFDFDDYEPMPHSKILLHKPWAEEPYERNSFPFGEDEIYTSDGTRARSKAEALIYEGLQKYKVPFKYDALMSRVGKDGIPFVFAPDFAFEDANLEEFYWEFCGMMDDEEYVRRHLQKRENYEKVGIVPWKNIIYSYSSGNDIDMAYVESVIRNQIIPRL